MTNCTVDEVLVTIWVMDFIAFNWDCSLTLFAQIGLITSSLLLKDAVVSFIEITKSCKRPNQQLQDILTKEYCKIKNLSTTINAAISVPVFFHWINGLAIVSLILDGIFTSSDWFSRLQSLQQVLMSISFFYISAKICTKVWSLIFRNKYV